MRATRRSYFTSFTLDSVRAPGQVRKTSENALITEIV